MEFEFDQHKSDANKIKHGIDFVRAQVLWQDPGRIEILARTEDESRFLVIGKIVQQHWPAVVTYRDGTVRITSVRRSRATEVEIYEGKRV